MKRRGQAAVEMSIMMVVIIPLIFYAMFLQDLLSYRLDMYESITSTPWDFMVLNFQKGRSNGGTIGSIQRPARLTFADHTSAYNTYGGGVDYDLHDIVHHNGVLAAHACWVAGGRTGSDGLEKQVSCGADALELGSGQVPSWADSFQNHSSFGTRRLFWCHAQLGVVNKFLPQQFMQNFGGNGGGGWSQVKLIDKVRYPGDTGISGVHGGDNPDTDSLHIVRSSAPNSDQFLFIREYFSVVHDPWALNDKGIPELKPSDVSGQHVIYERARFYWDKSARGQASSSYVTGASDVYDGKMDKDNEGDHVPVPPMHWKDETDRQNLKHYSSGWEDSRHQSADHPDPIYNPHML